MRVANWLVASNVDKFLDSPNARKGTRVGMVNSFQFNGMETQGFPSTGSPAPFHGTGPAVYS